MNVRKLFINFWTNYFKINNRTESLNNLIQDLLYVILTVVDNILKIFYK